MKTAFVTGAAGFIGGYIARQFADEGWHVIALVHRTVSEHLEHLAREGAATLVQGDLLEADALRERLTGALAGCGAKLDAVVHCAGRASDVGWRAEFRKTNFEAVRKLVRISRELEAGRFVFISTTDVYGLRDYHGESEEELPLVALDCAFREMAGCKPVAAGPCAQCGDDRLSCGDAGRGGGRGGECGG